MPLRLFRNLILSLLLLNTIPAAASELEETFQLLSSGEFNNTTKAINILASNGHEASEQLLAAMLESRLYYQKKDNRIVLIEPKDSKYQLIDPLSGEDLGTVSKRKVKKVRINNTIRGQIKAGLSLLKLKSPDPDLRLTAVETLMTETDADILAQLRAIRTTESDSDVIRAIDEVLAYGQLNSADIDTQLAAIKTLEGNLNQSVLLRLKQLQSSAEHESIRVAAGKAAASIESRVSFYGYLETLFFGLSLGSILALAAIGLAITFGVMGVINMAHGELIMIGAYTTYVIQLLMPEQIGMSILVSIPAAFLISGMVGMAIEHFVIRFLYGRPLETLLATFGISLVLQQTVRTIFSPLNRPVESPDWMSGSLQINPLLSVTNNRIVIFLFCLVVFALLYLIMSKTSLGLQVRAISQNRSMARAMGIRSQWVDAMTFGLGSGIAGVAGVALSQITNVGPNLGQAYIVDSFMVVVFGGVGNLWGTLISGLSLGVISKFIEPVSGAVLAKIIVLVFIILYIQKRPRGMFPQKGRAADQ